MLAIFKKHYLILVLALIVGSLTLLPQLFAVKTLGHDFKGIYHTVGDDERYYLARGQDIIDGHNFLSNPYLFEYKKGSPMQVWLPDYLMAKPLSVLKIDVVHGYLFYDFLLTFILTILTYIAVYLLTNHKFYSLAAAATLHLGLFLEEFNRSPSPQFNFIFWLLLLIFLIKFIQSNKKIYLILSGLVLGSLFYSYTYYWTFYFIVLFIFIFLGALAKKNIIIFRSYLYLIVGAMVVALPYFISLYNSSGSPYYNESLIRLGMLNTHFPSGLKIVAMTVAVLIIFFIAYKREIIRLGLIELFLLAGGLAGAVSVNQHVITGKNLEFSSHYLLESEFWLVIILFYLLSVFIKKLENKKAKKYILGGVIVFVILISSFNIFQTVKKQIILRPEDAQQQNYAEILNRLNDNAPKDSVVFADKNITEFIPAYTSLNVFFSRNANLFFISNREVEKRFIINNYWENFSQEFILSSERSIWGTEYINSYNHGLNKNKLRKLFFLPLKNYVRVPGEEIDRVITLAHQMQKQDFKSLLGDYRVDYLVWDKNVDVNWRVEKLNFLSSVYEKNNIIIYKIIR